VKNLLPLAKKQGLSPLALSRIPDPAPWDGFPPIYYYSGDVVFNGYAYPPPYGYVQSPDPSYDGSGNPNLMGLVGSTAVCGAPYEGYGIGDGLAYLIGCPGSYVELGSSTTTNYYGQEDRIIQVGIVKSVYTGFIQNYDINHERCYVNNGYAVQERSNWNGCEEASPGNPGTSSVVDQ
jgi:hypothetical protein